MSCRIFPKRERCLMRGCLAVLGLAGLSLACISAPPVIRDRVGLEAPGVMHRLIVLPFQLEPGQIDDLASPELIERYVAEELARVGYDVIPAQDFRVADEQASARAVDRREQFVLASSEFGASGAFSGQVRRYQHRKGQQYGALRPASVAFDLRLFDIASGRLVWSGTFDETQQSLSSSPLRAREYPGGGTRWLSAPELAQWGVQAAVTRLKLQLK